MEVWELGMCLKTWKYGNWELKHGSMGTGKFVYRCHVEYRVNTVLESQQGTGFREFVMRARVTSKLIVM